MFNKKMAAVFIAVAAATSVLAQNKKAAPAQAAAAIATEPVKAPEAPKAETPAPPKWYETIKISGMIRLRPEIKENFAFDANQKYNFVGQKVWLTAEKEFSDKSKAVVTLQDVRIWGGQTSSLTGIDTSAEQQAVDVREAYLQLKDFLWTPLELKAGRQKLVYGEEMLLGSLDWANVGRSFDGAKLMYNTENNSLHLLGFVNQGSRSNDLNNTAAAKQTTYLSGFYDQWKISRAFMLDIFGLARNQDNDTANQLYTAGVRFSNRTEPGNKTPKDMLIDYSIEGAYQGGRKAGKEIEAYGAVAFIGVNFEAGLKMRVGTQGAYASGGDPNDSKYRTFDSLYPTPHYQFGQADMTSWRNLTGAGLNYTVAFSPDFNIKLDYWYAMRTHTADYWYSISGAANTSTAIASMGGEKELYQELGVLVNYKARDYLNFQSGYSYTMRGKAMNAATKSGDYQFAYLMSTLTF